MYNHLQKSLAKQRDNIIFKSNIPLIMGKRGCVGTAIFKMDNQQALTV